MQDVPGDVRIVGRVIMTRREYKCNYVPLVRLSSLLTRLRQGEGIIVAVETSRFSVESVASLARSYGAALRVLSSRGDLVTLLLRK